MSSAAEADEQVPQDSSSFFESNIDLLEFLQSVVCDIFLAAQFYFN
jgi:hypothetical protein